MARVNLGVQGDPSSLEPRKGAPTAGTVAFEVQSLTMRYPTRQGELLALSDVDLQIRAGEFVTLIGPSGCGKSTLLEIMGGLRRPTSGSARFDGRPIAAPIPDRIAFVFQSYSLFPWRTALQNVDVGLQFRGVGKRVRRERAMSALELVGLAGHADAYPTQLSGGMQQRVAIARALACDPEVLLMDEPFGALDEQTRLSLGEELGRILVRTGCTIVFVTHSLAEAILLSDRIFVMQTDPGSIAAEYSVDEPRPRPADFVTDPGYLELHRALFHHLRPSSDLAAGTTTPE